MAGSLKSKNIAYKNDSPPEYAVRAKPKLFELNQFNLATPCLELFKNVYMAVNGDIKPCCFSRGSAIGNAFDDGFGVWGNAPFSQFRSGVLNGQYPTICNECIRLNNAPAKHNIGGVVAQYSKWFQHVFGVPFSSDAQVAARKLADNLSIISNWKNK